MLFMFFVQIVSRLAIRSPFRLAPILVAYGCYNKWPQSLWLKTTTKLSSYSSGGQQSRTGLTGLKARCWLRCFLQALGEGPYPGLLQLLEPTTFWSPPHSLAHGPHHLQSLQSHPFPSVPSLTLILLPPLLPIRTLVVIVGHLDNPG